MNERPIEQLTLRELFTDAEMLSRELTEHLEQSFLPRIRDVEQAVRNYSKREDREEVADATVRSRTSALLGSDDFTQQLLGRFEEYLSAIYDRAGQASKER